MAQRRYPRFHDHFLNDLLELLPVGVVIVDEQGGTIHINRAARRIWGNPEPARPFWAQAEVKSLVTGARVEPPDFAVVRALADGDATNEEEVELTADDGTRFVQNSVAPIRDPEGKIIAAVVVSRDITWRITRDRHVRASEAKYRYLFDNNPRPMWVYDKETLAFLAVNAAAIAHYGYSREEFLRMTIVEIHPPALREALINAVRDSSRGPGDFGVWKHRKKDGTLIDAELATHDIRLEDRDAALVSVTDVSERVKLEALLRESEKQYRRIVETALEGIWIVSANGQTSYINPQGAQILGYAPEEMLGRPAADILFPGAPPQILPWQEGTAGNWSARLRRKDLHEAQLLGSAVPISDDHGIVSASLVTFMDITDMQRLQDSTRLAQDRLDRALKVSPVILFNQDAGLRYTWIHGSTEQFGTEEVLGKSDMELFPPEAAERLRAIKQQVLESGTRARAIVDLPLHSRHVYIDLIVEPLRGREQQSMGITGVAMDITERMTLTQELSETRKQLEEAINSTRTILWSWNVENDELWYSSNAAAIFGLSSGSRATTLEEQLNKLVPGDAQEVRRNLAEAVSQKRPVNTQFRYVSRETGRELWFEACGHFSYDHFNQARFLRGVLYDITDRKHIEEVLRANENRFRQIVVNSPDPLVMLDENGIIQCISRAAGLKLGYSTDELVGQPVLSLVSSDQRTHVLDQVQKFLDSKKEASAGLARVYRRDRSPLWIEVDVSQILAGHAVQGYLVRFAELDLGYTARTDEIVHVHSHGLP